MATIRSRNGKFQVQIRRRGYPLLTSTFITRSDARRWARDTEARIELAPAGTRSPTTTTLANLICRYRDEVTPLKRGHPQETRRLNRLLRDPVAGVRVTKLSPALFSSFRDRRLPDGPRACAYDLILLRSILRRAREEWSLPLFINPLAGVRLPKPSRPRSRRLTTEEMQRLIAALIRSKTWYLRLLVLLALETGMRRGELLQAKWTDLDPLRRLLVIRETKNGDDRTIPLSSAALAVLNTLARVNERVFPITDVAVRQSWDRVVRRASLTDFRFHDLRHEAISRFFEKGLSVPEVALISGHRDYRMLARYTHLRPEEIARRLG